MKLHKRIRKGIKWFPTCLVVFLGCAGLIILSGGCTDSGNGYETENGVLYYVSPDGDDANPGTLEMPWRTIQKAADTLVAGETVMIRAGTYTERVIPRNSGTPNRYIVYRAFPGEMVVIDGLNLEIPEWGGLFDILDKSYIRVSGLSVVNVLSNPHNLGFQVDHADHVIIEGNQISLTNDSGIGVWASTQVIIEGNEIYQACRSGWNECITVGDTDGFEIRKNLVHHSRKEGICAKDGSRNGKVWGNHVYSAFSVGIYLDAWDKHTYTIEVFQNTVHDIVSGSGISLASETGGLLENISVYNNVCFHNQYLGVNISINGISYTHPMNRIHIINNTCSHNGWSDWGGGIALDNAAARNVVIRNNICCFNLNFQMAAVPESLMPDVLIDHNLVYPFSETENEITGDIAVLSDPVFANRLEGNFHLQSGSPAIDRGSAEGAPAVDFDGISRPQGTGIDIGAFEFR